MSDFAEIVVLVEGDTEKIFMAEMVVPHLSARGVYVTPIILSKPGQKGGDVKFARAKHDIETHLKQRSDTYISLLVDYYGVKSDWPGYHRAANCPTADAKAETINAATAKEVDSLFGEYNSAQRFIPYMAMHEFEAMLFADPAVLAQALYVGERDVKGIIRECNGNVEEIDDSPQTASSKRLEGLYPRFKKTTTGISILKTIGLPGIRKECPLFDEWMGTLEKLCEE